MVSGNYAQLAWDNETVSQAHARIDQIASGYEDLARVLAGLLAGLAGLGLPEADASEVKSNAEAVLGEVTKAEPDQDVVRRRVTLLKGLLAPIVTGTAVAVSEESAELARKVIEGLGSTLPF